MSNIIKTNFLFTKNAYNEGVANGTIATEWHGLDYKELTPNYTDFWNNLTRVGSPWGWDEMEDRFSEQAMYPTLKHSETRLRLFTADEKEIGYVLVVPTDRSLNTKFDEVANDNNIIEFLTIGLYPEECGKKLGWHFFEMQFKDLFQRYDAVYWSSSSTNHPTLMDFYERQGAKILSREIVPDPRAEQRKFG